MSATLSPANPSAASRENIVLLPATKFFVRRIPLVAGQAPGPQVEMALETIGPFAPGQLYYGYHPSADGTQALAFAAYRRNFSAAETATWAEAGAVLPAFALWLGQTAPTVPAVWLHEQGGSVAAVLWDGEGSLPAGVIAREIAERPVGAVREELLLEARARLGAASAQAQDFSGEPAAGALTKEGLSLTLGDRSADFAPATLRAMDVRDKVEFAGQLGKRQRDRKLWLAFAATVGVLAACVAVELGVRISDALLSRQRAKLEAAAEEVRRIEQANQLVMRMEQLAGQSLRPFEMLALLNASRPATLEFVRASTTGPRSMDIEAQSVNAADPQEYEKALAGAPAIEKAELRDFRTTGGRTTFLVAVTFKPGFAGKGGTP